MTKIIKKINALTNQLIQTQLGRSAPMMNEIEAGLKELVGLLENERDVTYLNELTLSFERLITHFTEESNQLSIYIAIYHFHCKVRNAWVTKETKERLFLLAAGLLLVFLVLTAVLFASCPIGYLTFGISVAIGFTLGGILLLVSNYAVNHPEILDNPRQERGKTVLTSFYNLLDWMYSDKCSSSNLEVDKPNLLRRQRMSSEDEAHSSCNK